AYRRLRAVDAFACAGEAAGVDDRNEAAEKVEVEHGRASFIFQLESILPFNFQMATRKPIWVTERIVTHAHCEYRLVAARYSVATPSVAGHGGSFLPALGIGVFGCQARNCGLSAAHRAHGAVPARRRGHPRRCSALRRAVAPESPRASPLRTPRYRQPG